MSWTSYTKYINEPSEFYSYEAIFKKKDSSLIFVVDSKSKEFYNPIYINNILITSKGKNITITFVNNTSMIKVDSLCPLKLKLKLSTIDRVFIIDHYNKKNSAVNSELGKTYKEKADISSLFFKELPSIKLDSL